MTWAVLVNHSEGRLRRCHGLLLGEAKNTPNILMTDAVLQPGTTSPFNINFQMANIIPCGTLKVASSVVVFHWNISCLIIFERGPLET